MHLIESSGNYTCFLLIFQAARLNSIFSVSVRKMHEKKKPLDLARCQALGERTGMYKIGAVALFSLDRVGKRGATAP
jgi:hypothetical protein